MALLDPAWRKLVDRSPSWFAAAIDDWDDQTTQWLAESGVPRNGYALCKSFIYGRVGMGLQSLTGAWSSNDADFLSVQTRNAEKLLPKRFRGALHNIISELWVDGLFRAAHRGPPPPVEARDGQTPETAVVLSGATDNMLAIGSILLAATNSHLTVRSVERDAAASLTLLRVGYTYTPPLGLAKDGALCFEVRVGGVPTLDPQEYDRLKVLPTLAAL